LTTTTTTTGVIKTLSERKFGFITDQTGQDVFFHQSGLVGVDFESLKVGDELSFTLTDTPKGPRAEGITRTSASTAAAI
jgi:CspA family cold shock protein